MFIKLHHTVAASLQQLQCNPLSQHFTQLVLLNHYSHHLFNRPGLFWLLSFQILEFRSENYISDLFPLFTLHYEACKSECKCEFNFHIELWCKGTHSGTLTLAVTVPLLTALLTQLGVESWPYGHHSKTDQNNCLGLSSHHSHNCLLLL